MIAITGSNGKTTLKEMTAAILARQGDVRGDAWQSEQRDRRAADACRLPPGAVRRHRAGCQSSGEIHYLSGLVKPDVAVLNNAGRAHLEGFGSLEGVARAGPRSSMDWARTVSSCSTPTTASPAFGVRSHKATGSATFGVVQAADVSNPPGPIPSSGVTRVPGAFPARCEQGEIDVRLRPPVNTIA